MNCTVLEAAALKNAPRAIDTPADPPEFRCWLKVLTKPNLRNDEREQVYAEMYDFLGYTDENFGIRPIRLL
jgi:hypothetical protein